ncbi:hypothetical protein AGMMS49975_15080 [Clostridia bacterium]|nr:hypothetical protein AGMMS49975_15080 [Clostridia bacterium]
MNVADVNIGMGMDLDGLQKDIARAERILESIENERIRLDVGVDTSAVETSVSVTNRMLEEIKSDVHISPLVDLKEMYESVQKIYKELDEIRNQKVMITNVEVDGKPVENSAKATKNKLVAVLGLGVKAALAHTLQEFSRSLISSAGGFPAVLAMVQSGFASLAARFPALAAAGTAAFGALARASNAFIVGATAGFAAIKLKLTQVFSSSKVQGFFSMVRLELQNAAMQVGVFGNAVAGTLKGIVSIAQHWGLVKAGIALAVTEVLAFKAAITTAVPNADYEKNLGFYKILVGDLENAKGLLEEMRGLSVSSPLDQNAIQDAGKTLMSFGIESKKIMGIVKQLGDISGGESEQFKRLALVYAQVASTGKLMGQDLLQLINAGFNPLLEISQKTGQSIAKLKDIMANGEGISSEAVAEAFISATSEGGRFYGMMESQSQTLYGSISTLKGIWKEFVRAIGEKSFETLRDALQTISNEVVKLSESGKLAKWADGIGTAINAIIKPITSLTTFLIEHREVANTLKYAILAANINKIIGIIGIAGSAFFKFGAVLSSGAALVGSYGARIIGVTTSVSILNTTVRATSIAFKTQIAAALVAYRTSIVAATTATDIMTARTALLNKTLITLGVSIKTVFLGGIAQLKAIPALIMGAAGAVQKATLAANAAIAGTVLAVGALILAVKHYAEEWEKAYKMQFSADIKNGIYDAIDRYEKLKKEIANDSNKSDREKAEQIQILDDEIKKLQKDLGIKVQAEKEDAEVTKNSAEKIKEYVDAIKNSSSAIAELNQIQQKLSENEALNAKEIDDLISKYPQLASKIEKTAEGYKIQTGTIDLVRVSALNSVRVTMKAQEDETRAVIEQSSARLKAYGIELSTIQSLNDAKREASKIARPSTADLIAGIAKNNDEMVKNLSDYKDKVDTIINPMLDYGALIDANKERLKMLQDIKYGVDTPKPKKEKEEKDDSAEKAKKAREEFIKEQFDNLKFLRDTDEVSELTYYSRLEELRDIYLTKNSSEWRSYTADMHNFQKEQRDKSIEDAKSDFSKSLEGMKINIDERDFYDNWSLPTQKIDELNAMLAAIDDGYEQNLLDKEEYLDKIREINREIYNAEKELTKNLISEQEKRLSDLKKFYSEQYELEKKKSDKMLKSEKSNTEAILKSLKDDLANRKKSVDAQIKEVRRQADAQKKAYDDMNRAKDIGKLQAQEAVFRSAVTVEGRNEYERIKGELEKYAQEQRQTELEEIANARAEAWQADYDKYEQEAKIREEAIQKRLDDIRESEAARLDELRQLQEDEVSRLQDILGELKEMKYDAANRNLEGLADAISAAYKIVNESTTNNTQNTTNNNITMNNNVSDNQTAKALSRSVQLAIGGGASVYA